MGYKKIVQYGDIIETYEYDKPLSKRKNPSRLKAWQLAEPSSNTRNYATTSKDVKKNRKIRRTAEAKAKGIYNRSKSSIKRSRTNFFRLVHHNNCYASSIHFFTLTFIYDVTYTEACRHVARFMERVRKFDDKISVSYISVAELTEKNRFHFHLLVYNLSPRLAGYSLQAYSQKGGEITSERKTRDIQVLFQRGYVDVVLVTRKSPAIAGYMGKYMAKSLADKRYETVRGYNCSRNIITPKSYGSNTLSDYDSIIFQSPVDVIDTKQYDVPYLGSCRFTKIMKKI